MRRISFVAILWAAPAHAYDQPVHEYLSARAYRDSISLGDAREDPAAAANALRDRIWRAGAESKDAELRKRFLARYPERDKLDAWELKRFLGLNPDKSVAGLDGTALPDGDARAVYVRASRLPDDDFRNRMRFRHDAARSVMHDPYGRPLPEDPATLEMGSLDGLSSQAHAHYGLPKIPLSDDPEVLKKDPRRFAVPPTVHTFGAEFAELYTALAVISLHLPSAKGTALVHAGAAAHHLEDVANQIHTVQVGLYDFFVDAKLQSIKEELLSVGGLLRQRPTFVSIGIEIIANHHVLLENLFAKHLLRDGDPVRKQAESAPRDPDFQRAVDAVAPGCVPGFAQAIAEALIERSSHEGPRVYALIRAAADRKLSRVGVKYPGDDPANWLRPNADLTEFFTLQTRGAARSDQALAAWWDRFSSCAAAPDAEAHFAESLVRARLDALDAAELRARAFVPKPPTVEKIAIWVPALYLVVLLGAIGLAGWLRRRARRR